MKFLMILAILLSCSMLLVACSASMLAKDIQEETAEHSFVQVTFKQAPVHNCIDIPAEHALMKKCGLDQDCYAAFS